MIKGILNYKNKSQYYNYFYRLNIDNQDFYIKVSGNYDNLTDCILYRNTHYRGPEIQCKGDYYSNVMANFLSKFPNTIEEEQENLKGGEYAFTLYTYQEIKKEPYVIKDKLFKFYKLENNRDKVNKDNFIELCFDDRQKNHTEKEYLKEEDFIERLSKDEIMVYSGNGKYVKTIHKNKKGEEYIKTGQMSYKSNIVYLTEEQKYVEIKESTTKAILVKCKELLYTLGAREYAKSNGEIKYKISFLTKDIIDVLKALDIVEDVKFGKDRVEQFLKELSEIREWFGNEDKKDDKLCEQYLYLYHLIQKLNK